MLLLLVEGGCLRAPEYNSALAGIRDTTAPRPTLSEPKARYAWISPVNRRNATPSMLPGARFGGAGPAVLQLKRALFGAAGPEAENQIVLYAQSTVPPRNAERSTTTTPGRLLGG